MPTDPLARFMSGPSTPRGEVPDPQVDPMARFMSRPQEVLQPANTLGEEFGAGLRGGIDSFQAMGYGLYGLMGRELGITALEDIGKAGAARNFDEASRSGRESQGFTDIENAGGFFKWAAASLGEAIPSLGTAMLGGGIGSIAGKKLVEMNIKKTLGGRIQRKLMRQGATREEASDSARRIMASEKGQQWFGEAVLKGKTSQELMRQGFSRGQKAGVLLASIPPQVGATDLELQAAGVDSGFTSLVAGVAGGALEALPALRLMDKMFPGVPIDLSKQFVKDFAVGAGKQLLIEGGTEGAQEIIQMAALAYHDPSFDIWSPEARKRVIDAFAAGAIVGAVSGGGAEGVAQLQGLAAEGKERLPDIPPIESWRFRPEEEGAEKFEDGFEAADNTVWQEIRDRLYGAVGPQIEAAVNGAKDKIQPVIDAVNVDINPGMNGEGVKLFDVVNKAHQDFIERHKEQFAALREHLKQANRRIYEAAKSMPDPEARRAFVEREIEAAKAQARAIIERIRRGAAQRDQDLTAEVDNMDFDDEILDELEFGREDVIDETERRVGPSGRKFDRSVGPTPTEEAPLVGPGVEVGEVEAQPSFTFGKFQKQPRVGVSGETTVAGYDTREQAEKGIATLLNEIPNATRQDFEIRKQDDGTFVAETKNPDFREDITYNERFAKARRTAQKDNPKDSYVIPKRVYEGRDDTKLTNPKVHIPTLAWAGMKLDAGITSLREGMAAMAAKMMERGDLDSQAAQEIMDEFDKIYPPDDQDSEVYAPVSNYQSKNAATAAMLKIRDRIKEAFDVQFAWPKDMITVRDNGDGTHSFVLSDPRAFKALRKKSPQQAAAIVEAVKAERRAEKLSGEPIGPGGRDTGVSADPRGTFAGDPDVTGPQAQRDTLGPRSQEPVSGNVRQTDIFVNEEGKTVREATLTESRESQQETDQETNPENQPSEFETRHQRNDPKLDKVDRQRRDNTKTGKTAAQPQTAEDNRLLKKVWGRIGKVKVMMSQKSAAQQKTRTAVRELVTFVRNTLGLKNSVVVMDDGGLLYMIENGLVSDPIFKETLNDPNVHARNIRVGDTSYVYLSDKLAGNPQMAVLALGHEMGHHLYSVAWNNLSAKGQQQLRDASKTKTEEEFNEWMADQLAAWITKRAVPKTAVDKFFSTVGAKIRQLYDFMKGRPRFELNQTFSDFADAVSERAGRAGNVKDASDAQTRAWFKNDGVTMYKFWGGLPKENQAPAKKTFRPHSSAEIRDMAYRRGLELDNLYEERESAAKPRRAALDKRINELESEIAELSAEAQRVSVSEKLEREAGVRSGAETDNMTNPFGDRAMTEGMEAAVARFESKYPAIVKRAALLRNWVNSAYDMLLAPSTSVMKSLGKRVPVAKEIAELFGRHEHGTAKGEVRNYHQRVNIFKGQFSKRFDKVVARVQEEVLKERPDLKGRKNRKQLSTLVNARMRKYARSLRGKEGHSHAKFQGVEADVRNLFDEMHKYAEDMGLPVRNILNYFPRQFDQAKLVQNKQEILDHLMDDRQMGLTEARNFYNSLIDPNAQDGRATSDAVETPGFKHMNSRTARDAFMDKYLDDNLEMIVSNYINSVVKRAEFNRILGEPMPATDMDVDEAIRKGLWDPKAQYHRYLRQARKENATDEELKIIEKYIDANLGQLGRDDINPGARKFMAGMMAYQNMRVLLFTVFASLPDMAGPAIRAGSMKDAFISVKNNMKKIATDQNALHEMARAYGIISDTLNDHIMTEYVDNHYMPPTARKWNDAFFKYTGLNWYTNATRKMALAVGIDYIQSNMEKFYNPANEKEKFRAQNALDELGLTPEIVKGWVADGKPTYESLALEGKQYDQKIAEALVQFVDESIMRPNAAQRPIMASHPAAMLVYHLKGYLYAVHEVVLKRMKYNVDEAQTPAQYAAALAPALAMMAMTAIGLELRELIQYAGSNRKPPTDQMDGWEYTFELMQRSGLTGISQLAFDFTGADDRGMSHVAGIGGPALSQAAQVISKPHTQTIPKAIPVLGQIPAGRDAVRTVL